MRILAFRHVPFEGLGLIEASLSARGIGVHYASLYESETVPDIAEYDGLILLGGPMSVNDDLPYLRQEMRLILQAVARRQPVLGICLGAQLIARALGAAVRRNPSKEIGWFPLHFTAAASGDPLFHGLVQPETVFHWHGETFDIPDGAELLASSGLCRNQAFRLGSGIYGLQFHLEVTPDMIAAWCVQDQNCGDVRELLQPINPRHNTARLAALSDLVFGRWCELL